MLWKRKFAMRSFHLMLAIWGVCLMAADLGAAQQPRPESREYKIMLAPDKFPLRGPGNTTEELWESIINPIIAGALDRRDNGKPRHKGSLVDSKQRQVTFRDTSACVLNRHGYTLRECVKVKKGKPEPESAEATLKFRTPDLIIAAEALPSKGKVKFEEDIAPLIRVNAGGSETAQFAKPPSMRSLFSVSITTDLEPSYQLLTVDNASALYPDLQHHLQLVGAGPVRGDAQLRPGSTFHEVVFDGASVDLGAKVDAEFDLSLWYKNGTLGTAKPKIAELSFKYTLSEGPEAGPAARRALALFKALQSPLGDWASPDRETKTSIALPAACH
jgi:hypothetical protein